MPNDWDEDRDDEPFEDEVDDSWDDDDVDLVACPQCGADVYEEAERCPYCGSYIVRSSSLWQNKPWWWVALGLVGIMAVIWLLSFGLQ